MQNYHILTVKYVGFGANTDQYVKIISERFKESIKVDWNYDLENTMPIALNWLANNGYNVIGQGIGKDHYYIITDTFLPLKPQRINFTGRLNGSQGICYRIHEFIRAATKEEAALLLCDKYEHITQITFPA